MITVYDLETTGLPKPGETRTPGIIQVAALKYDFDGNEIGSFNERVNPELLPNEWEDGAIKVTGIGPNNVQKEWPSFFSVARKFAHFVEGSKVLCGYNIIGFDDGILFNQLCRYGYEKHFPWPIRRIDVMDVSKAYNTMVGKKGNKRPKLTEIYEQLFQEKMQNAHDALADVRGTARVLFKIGQPEIEKMK